MKMTAILDFFKWPHILPFLIDEGLSLVKISRLLPKWHNSHQNMHQTAVLLTFFHHAAAALSHTPNCDNKHKAIYRSHEREGQSINQSFLIQATRRTVLHTTAPHAPLHANKQKTIHERSIVMSESVSVSLCACVCLSAIISSERHSRSSPNFLCIRK